MISIEIKVVMNASVKNPLFQIEAYSSDSLVALLQSHSETAFAYTVAVAFILFVILDSFFSIGKKLVR